VGFRPRAPYPSELDTSAREEFVGFMGEEYLPPPERT